MFKLPLTRAVTLLRLNRELRAVNLPDFVGVAVLSRETDDEGSVVLGEDGRPQRVTPYLLIKAGAPTTAQSRALDNIIAAHIADPEPTRLDSLRVEKTLEFDRAMLPRVTAQVAEWDSMDAIKAAAGMMRGADPATLTPEQDMARRIFNFARIDAPTKLAALTTVAALEAVDPRSADPFGDGTPWP